MKKLLCYLILPFLFISALAASENLISFSAGISSGIPFYGKNSLSEKVSSIDTDNRVIIGSLASINLNVIKQVTFFTGADLLADFNWKDSAYAHHLNVAFPLGLKIFPGIGGLDLGMAYTLGFRADLSKNGSGDKANSTAAWGNGFKFLLEYDFAHDGTSKFLPTIGCSWNLMPRGNDAYDNLLTFYLLENF